MKMIKNLPIHSLHHFHLLFRIARAKTSDDTVEMEVEFSETESASVRVILHKYLQKAFISRVIYIMFDMKTN